MARRSRWPLASHQPPTCSACFRQLSASLRRALALSPECDLISRLDFVPAHKTGFSPCSSSMALAPSMALRSNEYPAAPSAGCSARRAESPLPARRTAAQTARGLWRRCSTKLGSPLTPSALSGLSAAMGAEADICLVICNLLRYLGWGQHFRLQGHPPPPPGTTASCAR